ncbi:hypothetical protein DVA86_28260 [Streptomyces armeniacus]|uniref:Uncharacterized protein n=1 Tax=Streptomyces armeniacus TaxID=83291 RepID=A0A345XWA8_9ACTN|nr:hypothetical protein [Streptomyces armeniacus]AXK35924.1 hypothetical protein DVA86_28260 [Streptomyces armeniacus]
MLDIGYSLSPRFPDPPQTDYRTADVRTLRHDLFCGDIHIADTESGRELSTAWGWLPVLDFGWALCDIVEELGPGGPPAAQGAQPRRAELDFTETTDCLLFEERRGRVEITADWQYVDDPPLVFPYATVRREARDFLHDLIADLADMHEGLSENPAVWQLQARFPRV